MGEILLIAAISGTISFVVTVMVKAYQDKLKREKKRRSAPKSQRGGESPKDDVNPVEGFDITVDL
ncbi:MAG: hypothetical protein ACE5DX_02845 [Candidatus Dojkabacteria bacterium]